MGIPLLRVTHYRAWLKWSSWSTASLPTSASPINDTRSGEWTLISWRGGGGGGEKVREQSERGEVKKLQSQEVREVIDHHKKNRKLHCEVGSYWEKNYPNSVVVGEDKTQQITIQFLHWSSPQRRPNQERLA